MKLKKFLFIFIFIVLICTNRVFAAQLSEGICESKAVDQLAMIIYNEVGLLTNNADEAFFAKLTTGSVALNNASYTSGDTIANKIQNMTDQQYQGHSTYKYSTIASQVSSPNEYIYVAGLVLSHKYNVPSNIIYQIAYSSLPGAPWAVVYSTYAGAYTTAFGTGGATIKSIDIFGKNVAIDSDSYRNLSKTLKLNDYSAYTLDNVCDLIAKNDSGSSDKPDVKNIDYYTVTYDLNDGKFPTDETSRNVIVSSEDPIISRPAVNPIKENSKFIGWYNGEMEFNFNSDITSDITLTAKYSSFDGKVGKCNLNDEYDPSINKCISIAINDNLKLISTIYNYDSSCDNGKNTISNEKCSGACNTITANDYSKEYWKYSDTCKVASSCSNVSSCKQEIKAYFYKIYDPISDDTKNDNSSLDNKTFDEISNNAKTGDALIFIVWIIGVGALCYSGYYFYNIRKKVNN